LAPASFDCRRLSARIRENGIFAPGAITRLADLSVIFVICVIFGGSSSREHRLNEPANAEFSLSRIMEYELFAAA